MLPVNYHHHPHQLSSSANGMPHYQPAMMGSSPGPGPGPGPGSGPGSAPGPVPIPGPMSSHPSSPHYGPPNHQPPPPHMSPLHQQPPPPPMSSHPNSPHYGPPNHQAPPAPMTSLHQAPPPHMPPLHQAPPLHHAPPPSMPPLHHAPPLPLPGYMSNVHPAAIERGSPFYQNIPQTEFRIIELNKRLQNRPRQRVPPSPLPCYGSSDEINWWERFACDFFDDDSTLTLRIPSEDKPIEYTIGRTLIPRFFRSYFEGGVIDLSIKLRNIREIPHHNMISLECDRTDITTKNVFKHPAANMAMNVVVHTEGRLSLDFVNNSFDALLIKSWIFNTSQCHEYIDRSMTTTGLPNAYLVEPVTRFGLTKSTIAYLKMCMIMEPMQDLMLHHRQTKMDPRSCLKHLLYDKYKLKNVEDNRVQPNKRRKRKTPASGGAGSTKKGKASANNTNAINNNNMGFNNSLMSPANMGGGPNLSLASQDVLVVGEPSMLGADFGDENERRITRLENNQFDTSVNGGNGNNNDQFSQNQSQMCNNINNKDSNQPNNIISHMQQQYNHDTGGNSIPNMLNHTNSNHNNNNNGNGIADPSLANTNSYLTSNSPGTSDHQMNSITMNGGVNHMNHLVKSEMDIKQPLSASTQATTES